jgi:branched-chain amino acid transport system ATP-binding protein
VTTRRRHSTERARVVVGRAGPPRGRFDHAREAVRDADAAADAFFRPNVWPEGVPGASRIHWLRDGEGPTRADHRLQHERGRTVDETVLKTRGLTKVFGGFTAVRNVDLAVRRGSIHALIGANGAGKTTVFNLLTKFHLPTSGTIVYEGEDITAERPAATARRGMVRSFQISATFPHMSALENVRIALQRKLGISHHFWKSEKVLEPLNERARELLDDVGLGDYAETRAADLPYGRKRTLEIATTLALEPKMLLLDEPTQGMGVDDVDRIKRLIRKIAEGRTILMVEHNMSVVSDICSTITVLQRGEVLTEGSYDEVASDPAVRAAYMGGAHG